MTRLLAEDRPFLTGAAAYTADLHVGGVLTAVLVRSTQAHGHLVSVDAVAARRRPGVHAVFSAADLGLAPFAFFAQYPPETARPPLVTDRVRFVGEPLAVLVATSYAAARDGLDDVVVDIDPLPAVVDLDAAAAGRPALLFDDLGTNVVFSMAQEPAGDPLAGAATVVRRRYPSPRLSPLPLETSSIVVEPRADGGLDVWAACQGVHAVRDDIASSLSLDPALVRVRAPAVGGGFGARYRPPIEYLVIAAVARLLDRPVRWCEERSDQLVAQLHGRAQLNDLELGLRADGTFTGVRARGLADAGAYPNQGPLLVDYSRKMLPGPYRMPMVDYRGLGVVTNTAPVGAYRGAGQPEVVAALERAIDEGARALGIDPLEVRRRNLLGVDELPARTATGVTYDAGDFPAALAQAAELIGYDAVRFEQAARVARAPRDHPDPLRLGVGVACYAQITAAGRFSMRGQVAVDADGRVVAGTGGHSHGQGHRSTFAPLVAARLGIAPDEVDWVDADSAIVTEGPGTGGSRTAAIAGMALTGAVDRLMERARALAAARLEADPRDIVAMGGGLGVAGVPTSRLTWGQLAAEAGPSGLAEVHDVEPEAPNTPYGAHATVVEVDVETGAVRVRAHAAVDDCGIRLAPVLVEGQQHGGSVAGIAQALGEQVLYDLDGNPRTPTLVEYCVPAASELPFIIAGGLEVPATTNAVGGRGIGENGAIAATGAVLNAVADALGLAHVDLPLTPERVWRMTRGGPS